MKAVVSDKWILCPECGAKTRTQILDNTNINQMPDAKTQSKSKILLSAFFIT